MLTELESILLEYGVGLGDDEDVACFDWQEFSDKQLSVLDPANWRRLNFLDGSVRSGKTTVQLLAWTFYVSCYAPLGNLAMVGKTLRTLKRNMLEPLQDMFGPRLVTVNYGEGEATIAGRQVYLYGANDDAAVGKIQGSTLVAACCDEFTLYSERFVSMLTSRLSKPGSMLFAAMNPDSPRHHVYLNYLTNPDLQAHMSRWQFRLTDNLSLAPEVIAAIQREHAGLFYERYVEGKWSIAEGAVYGGLFDNDVHVVRDDDVPVIEELFIGVDYATSAHTAFILVGVGRDNCLYALDEFYYSGEKTGVPKTDVELALDLSKFLARYPSVKRLYVDPSAASFITLLKKPTYDFPPVRHGYNRSVLLGIRACSALFGIQRLKVHEKCANLLDEIGSYVWDENASLMGEDKPKKQFDHLLDALRYCVMGIRNYWKPWLTTLDMLPANKQQAAKQVLDTWNMED